MPAYIRLQAAGRPYKLPLAAVTDPPRPRVGYFDADWVDCSQSAVVVGGQRLTHHELTVRYRCELGELWERGQLHEARDDRPEVSGTRSTLQVLEPTTAADMLEHVAATVYELGSSPDDFPDAPHVAPFAYRRTRTPRRGFVVRRHDGELVMWSATAHGLEPVGPEHDAAGAPRVVLGGVAAAWRSPARSGVQLRTPNGHSVTRERLTPDGQVVPDDAATVRVRSSDGAPAHRLRVVHEVPDEVTGGIRWEPYEVAAATVGAEAPLELADEWLSPADLVRRRAVIKARRVTHVDAESYELLLGLAGELHARGELRRVTARDGGPLVLTSGGRPHEGWLSGLVDGRRYRLVVHLCRGGVRDGANDLPRL